MSDYYVFEENEHHKILEGRYWNCQGNGIAIVASITKGIDWSAYIGTDDSSSEEDTLRYVVKYGSKLSEKDARYFFDIDLKYRR
jgi:hypothetical protein